MIFYGASGHAKVIIEAWIASGGIVTRIFDDNLEIKNLLTFPVSGKYDPEKSHGVPLIIAIGSNATRKRIAGRTNIFFGKVVHPQATISNSSVLGEGTVVMAGVVINAESKIGKHVIVNTSAAVDHDCCIEDFVHIAPHATVCGSVVIGEGTHIGAGATVIQNIRIGKWATIGAGSVVIEDVPDFALVVGVPGRIKRIDQRI